LLIRGDPGIDDGSNLPGLNPVEKSLNLTLRNHPELPNSNGPNVALLNSLLNSTNANIEDLGDLASPIESLTHIYASSDSQYL